MLATDAQTAKGGPGLFLREPKRTFLELILVRYSLKTRGDRTRVLRIARRTIGCHLKVEEERRVDPGQGRS